MSRALVWWSFAVLLTACRSTSTAPRHRLELYVPLAAEQARPGTTHLAARGSFPDFWLDAPLPVPVRLQAAEAGEVVVRGIWTIYFDLDDASLAAMRQALAEFGQVLLCCDQRPVWWYGQGDLDGPDDHARHRYFLHLDLDEAATRALAAELRADR